MTTEQLRSMIRATPFRPFTIRTADGREVPVTHPEAIAYSGGRTVLVVYPDDHFEIIDLLPISSLVGSSSERSS